MRWTKYTLETTETAEEAVLAILWDLGIAGAEVEDLAPISEEDLAAMYVDIPPVLPENDGKSRISFYREAGGDDRILLDALEEALAPLRESGEAGSLSLTVSETAEEDWINNWKTDYHSFSVGRFRIRPAWEADEEAEAGMIPIEMDPGAAFGSGTHETTRLCLEGLEESVRPGMRVLDIGTGSGILSIAALKLGAAEAVGTELDEAAVRAAAENRERNGLTAEQFPILTGNILEDEALQRRIGDACFDVIAANIFAPVIIALTGEAGRHLKPAGLMIASGILLAQADAVEEAFREKPEWEFLDRVQDGEWVRIRARKR